MKFTIKKSDILHVLANVQGITGRKTNLAITANVLMRVKDGQVSLSATDLETGLEGIYPAVQYPARLRWCGAQVYGQ